MSSPNHYFILLVLTLETVSIFTVLVSCFAFDYVISNSPLVRHKIQINLLLKHLLIVYFEFNLLSL